MPKSKGDIAIERFANSITGIICTLVGALPVLAALSFFIYVGGYKLVLFLAAPIIIVFLVFTYKKKERLKEFYLSVRILLMAFGGVILVVLVLWAWMQFVFQLP